jgi:hypothetical protein
VDYQLHENPELKTARFVFLTDFVGYLPIDPREDSPESRLTSDYNAEMIEQVTRYPRVRDRALFVGDHDDIVPDRFGPSLPLIRDWTCEHFTAIGYINALDADDYTDVRAVRTRLGYEPDRPLVICTVGGTAVGEHLLRKSDRSVAADPCRAPRRALRGRCRSSSGSGRPPAAFRPRGARLRARTP